MATFEIRQAGCCGVYELKDISALSSNEAVIEQVVNFDFFAHPSYLYFIGVVGERRKIFKTDYHADRADDYAGSLAAYITEHGLAKELVDSIPESRNYSGNMLKMWVWVPDWDALETWLREYHASQVVPAVEFVTGDIIEIPLNYIVNPDPTAEV